jgi:hypothetical protein
MLLNEPGNFLMGLGNVGKSRGIAVVPCCSNHVHSILSTDALSLRTTMRRPCCLAASSRAGAIPPAHVRAAGELREAVLTETSAILRLSVGASMTEIVAGSPETEASTSLPAPA